MTIKKLRWKKLKAIAGTRTQEMETSEKEGLSLSLTDLNGLGTFVLVRRKGHSDHYVALNDVEYLIMAPVKKPGPKPKDVSDK